MAEKIRQTPPILRESGIFLVGPDLPDTQGKPSQNRYSQLPQGPKHIFPTPPRLEESGKSLPGRKSPDSHKLAGMSRSREDVGAIPSDLSKNKNWSAAALLEDGYGIRIAFCLCCLPYGVQVKTRRNGLQGKAVDCVMRSNKTMMSSLSGRTGGLSHTFSIH